ncbi:MAG: PAS domain S-box protein [Chloroflexi bacterium]|nr:PAS domain S-box protein [Chloroflexota bacterium]
MRVRSQIPYFGPSKQLDLGFDVVDDMLDLLPEAGLIVDLQKNTVIIANSKATQLTAHTRQELTTISLDSLLLTNNGSSLSSALHREVMVLDGVICQRSGSQLPIQISAIPVGQEMRLTVLKLSPRSRIQRKDIENKLQKNRWEALRLLLQASQKNVNGDSLERMLKAGQLLTGANTIVVYQSKKRGTNFDQIASHGSQNSLPSTLSPIEIRAIETYKLWKPGERPVTSLYKKAIASGLSYVASVPLNPSNPQDGILVAADQIGAPSDDIFELLNLMATLIFTAVGPNENASPIRDRLLSTQPEYQELLDNVHDGIILTSSECVVNRINPTCEDILGYSSAEVTGQNVEALLMCSPSIVPALKAARQGFPSHNLNNILVRHRKGRVFPAHIRVIPILSGENVEEIAIIIIDLSEQEEFRQQLQHLEQQAFLGETSAIFAHEVRNSLNNISTGLQLTAMILPSDDAAQKHINRIQGDFDRLTTLMKSVLSFSGRRDLRNESIDLSELLSKIVNKWRRRDAHKHISFNLYSPETTPKITGDARALEQVFANLISNGVTAIGDVSGDITIKINLPKGPGAPNYIDILISDSGPGVPEEIIDLIFDPFYTSKQEGTGLGLPISKRIIIAHNGKITAESFPGGTIFKIRLPVSNQG